MKSVLDFLKYNNLVPIALGVIFLGSGAAFAATDPQAVYHSQQQVMSVDNTYIATKDLSTWTPKILITGVTEDTDNYYVGYDFTTIDVVNYVWQDLTKHQTMTVSKADLGMRDLGLYVTQQFRNIIGNEVAYLTQVQQKALNDTTQKVVATTYGGLVGKFLDTSTETLPGYTPVVLPPIDDSGQTAAAAGAPGQDANGHATGGPSGGSSSLMSLQILGNNPVHLAVGSGYIDLGVVLIDPTNPNLGYHAFVDGMPSDPPSVDTSTTSAHSIEYRATDQAGNQLVVRRVVIIGNAADPGGEVNTAGNVPTSMPGAVVILDATSTPNTAPAPVPAPADAAATTTNQSAPAPVPAPAQDSSATTTDDQATTTAP